MTQRLPPGSPQHTQIGLVAASFGRHVLVETPTGQRIICHPRGKKNQAVVGDQVLWLPSQDEGTLETIQARRNLFYRQDEVRTKSFAANLDQILIFLAAEPEFSENQLARALIAAHAAQIKPIIALNKSDLTKPFAQAWSRLEPYRHMGYQVLPLAMNPSRTPHLKNDPSQKELIALLHEKKTLVLGPSGVGKSTLINQLVPQAQALTAEISQALHAGKHTTTSTTLYWVDQARRTALIDSPGFQEFGLHHIQSAQVAQYMPDIQAQAQQCKFYNCSHLHEPGCGVIGAMVNDAWPCKISPYRYKLYSEFYAELARSSY